MAIQTTQGMEEEDEGKRPPSPFLDGWKSVNPTDYPYPIPKQKPKPKPKQNNASSCTPSVDRTTTSTSISDTPINLKTPTVTQPETPLNNNNNNHNNKNNNNNNNNSNNKSNVKRKTTNTNALFIPKPKKSLVIPKIKNLQSPLDPSSVETIQPTTCEKPIQSTSLEDDNDQDPFADWGSPAPKEKEKETEIEIGEGTEERTNNHGTRLEEKEESTLQELKRAIKLDSNVLEIIIRMVIVQIQVIDSLKNHSEMIDILKNFKKQVIGTHKAHSKLYEKKLTEAVNKRRLIELEYDKVSSTIDEDLKKLIETSVSKHRKILKAPNLNLNGLFGDDWSPKPVIYLDSTSHLSVSSPIVTRDPRCSTSTNQPIQSTLPSDLRQEPIKQPSANNDDPWGWGNDAEMSTIDANQTNVESAGKSAECPWGADEPGETTSSKPADIQPLSTTNGNDAFGWGGGGGGGGGGGANADGGGDTWSSKANNNDAGGWSSNQNFDNNTGGWGNQNGSATGGDNNGGFEFRSRDSGWGGRGRGGGRGGGFSQDTSGFRGRGRGFGGEGGGFRGGRSRGFEGGGGGFRGRGRGFGNRNGFNGGNSNGFGDANGGWNNGPTDGFNNGGGNGFGETSFGGGNNNNFKGGWGESNNNTQGGFGDGFKSGWGEKNGHDSTKGGGFNSANNFKSGWDDTGDGGSGFKAGDNTPGFKGGFGGGGGDWQSPKAAATRPIVQYDAIAPENTNGADWGASNNVQPTHPTENKTTTSNDIGWGSPPPQPLPEDNTPCSKPFKDFDGTNNNNILPVQLDYDGTQSSSHIDKNNLVTTTIPQNSDVVGKSNIGLGNDENECPW